MFSLNLSAIQHIILHIVMFSFIMDAEIYLSFESPDWSWNLTGQVDTSSHPVRDI